MKKEDGLLFGSCTQPHGIKGGLNFRLLNTEESSLEAGSEIWIFPKTPASQLPVEGKLVKIKEIVFGHKVMVYLDGFTDRTAVENILPFDIYLARTDLPELDEDEVYLVDLEGLPVRDEQGVNFGVIESFYFNGAHDVVVITKNAGGQMDIPFIPPFLIEIDEERKFVVLKKLEFIE